MHMHHRVCVARELAVPCYGVSMSARVEAAVSRVPWFLAEESEE